VRINVFVDLVDILLADRVDVGSVIRRQGVDRSLLQLDQMLLGKHPQQFIFQINVVLDLVIYELLNFFGGEGLSVSCRQ